MNHQWFPKGGLTSSRSPLLKSSYEPTQSRSNETKLFRSSEMLSPSTLPSSLPTTPYNQCSAVESPYMKSPLPWFLRPQSPAPLPSTFSSTLSNYPQHTKSKSYRCITTVEGEDGGEVSAIAESGSFLYTAFADRKGIWVSKKPFFFEYARFGSRYGAVSALLVTDDKVYIAHHDNIRIWHRQFKSGGRQLKHKLLMTLPSFIDHLSKIIFKTYAKRVVHDRHSITALALGQNGVLYSSGGDKTVKVWRVSNARSCIEIIEAHDDNVNALVAGLDGLLYTASSDKRVRIWRRSHATEKHEVVKSLEGHEMAVNALALSCDGKALYSGGSDLCIRVWERNGGASLMFEAAACLNGHRQAVLCLAAVGSSLLCSGSADKTIRVWRRSKAGNGEYSCVSVLEGHRGGVKCVCGMLMDTKERCVIYSGSMDCSIRVWKVNVNAADTDDDAANKQIIKGDDGFHN